MKTLQGVHLQGRLVQIRHVTKTAVTHAIRVPQYCVAPELKKHLRKTKCLPLGRPNYRRLAIEGQTAKPPPIALSAVQS